MEEYNTFIRSMANQSAPSSLAEIREDVVWPAFPLVKISTAHSLS